MSERGVANIGDIKRLARDITDIFSDNPIEMAYFCGSIVNDEVHPNADIDIMVCCRDSVSERARNEFTEFYLDMHERTGRSPDVVSPGELMSVEQLEFGLSRIITIEPSFNLRNRYDFDYLCWAGMLVGKRVEILPGPRTGRAEVLALRGMERWLKRLGLDKRGYTLKTGTESDIDKILARNISCKGYYEAHG